MKQPRSPHSDISLANRPRVSSPNGVAGSGAFQPKNPNDSPSTIVAGGFCLVSLRDEKTWVHGDPKIQIILNDKIYLFAGDRQRDIFSAGPQNYLPVLEGDSIVAFAETGQRVSGNLEFGLTYRDRIYFFRNAGEQSEFQSQPERYVNADLVDQGNCLVSKIEEQKLVPGIPETVLTLDGMRYFFASTGHRRIFMAHPRRYVDTTEATFQDMQIRAGVDQDKGFNRYGIKREKREEGSKETAPEQDETSSDVYSRPAISGYCPVSIQKDGFWVRGKSRFKAVHDGKVYHMAGDEELAVFRENPREFLPALGGDSIVAFADEAQRIPGSAYHPLLAGGRLYLFADAVEKQKFKENPELYEDADLALGGNCIVSYLDEQQEVPGLPDFETDHQGLRFRFSSQALMEKFLADPGIYVDQFSVAQ
ncbi:hypothetical protein [Bythopirellula goksoeyrii]|nr:hypothetical protein [Bythopirellula goksoeyrii]